MKIVARIHAVFEECSKTAMFWSDGEIALSYSRGPPRDRFFHIEKDKGITRELIKEFEGAKAIIFTGGDCSPVSASIPGEARDKWARSVWITVENFRDMCRRRCREC